MRCLALACLLFASCGSSTTTVYYVARSDTAQSVSSELTDDLDRLKATASDHLQGLGEELLESDFMESDWKEIEGGKEVLMRFYVGKGPLCYSRDLWIADQGGSLSVVRDGRASRQYLACLLFDRDQPPLPDGYKLQEK